MEPRPPISPGRTFDRDPSCVNPGSRLMPPLGGGRKRPLRVRARPSSDRPRRRRARRGAGVGAEGGFGQEARADVADSGNRCVGHQRQAGPALGDAHGIVVLIAVRDHQHRRSAEQGTHHRAVAAVRDDHRGLAHHHRVRGAFDEHTVSPPQLAWLDRPAQRDQDAGRQGSQCIDHILEDARVILKRRRECDGDEGACVGFGPRGAHGRDQCGSPIAGPRSAPCPANGRRGSRRPGSSPGARPRRAGTGRGGARAARGRARPERRSGAAGPSRSSPRSDRGDLGVHGRSSAVRAGARPGPTAGRRAAAPG